MRQEYESDSLNEQQMAADPLETFTEWMYDAIAFGLKEPNAMTLATATPEGRPSARVVLLKEVQSDGFVFFTNYLSRKGRELMTNAFAAVVFDWHGRYGRYGWKGAWRSCRPRRRMPTLRSVRAMRRSVHGRLPRARS